MSSLPEELGDAFPSSNGNSGIFMAEFGEPDNISSKIDHLKSSKKYRSVFLTRLLDQIREALNRPQVESCVEDDVLDTTTTSGGGDGTRVFMESELVGEGDHHDGDVDGDLLAASVNTQTPEPEAQGPTAEECVIEILHLMKIIAQYDDATTHLSLLLADIVVYFARSPTLVRELLGVIEILCKSLDPNVVENTCVAFSELIYANTNQDLFLEGFVPLVFGFAESTYSAPRGAAALLLHCIYEFLEDEAEKEMVRSFFFTRLCCDVDVLVRRSCAIALMEWASILGPEVAPRMILPVLKEMSCDENHDSLRVQVVTSLPRIVTQLPNTCRSALLRLVVDLARDDSWRVRFVTGKYLGEFSVALTAAALAPSTILLADDPEREVRAVVANSLATVCENAPSSDLPKFFELSSNFAVDDSAVVRSALANVICSITSMAPKDQTDSLLPIVLRLLQETDTVKLQLIPSIYKLGQRLLSQEAVAGQLCEVLGNAMQSPKWRLREATAKLLRHFSPHLSVPCYQALVSDALALVVDSVADVRIAMVGTLATLSRQLGGKWSLRTLLSLSDCANHKSYRQRQSFACCLEVMLPFIEQGSGSGTSPSPSASGASTSDDFAVIEGCLKKLAEDPVPNVRMRLAQALSNATVPKEMAAQRLDLLKKLTDDSDVEVRAAATNRNSASDAPF